jgi:predicted enzyme related to lactoylglutathione lyase
VKILEFAFVAYSVTDLKRARAFYEDVLGFAPVSTWGDENQGWWEYEVGPHTLAITNMNSDWKPSPQGASVALEVDDFDTCIAHLKSHGVKFESEPFSFPACRVAIISDPDGNKIGIHKRHGQMAK